jgi:uncharacterized protein (TIGR04222 family)
MNLNPFDWPAEPFLVLYVTLAGVIFIAGFLLKSRIGPAALAPPQLNILELACLAGGANRAGDAALFRLMSGNGASITPGKHKITVTDQTPLEGLIDRPSRLQFEPEMTRDDFQKAVAPLVERVQERLRGLGYYPSEDQVASFRMTVLPCVGGLLAFGLLKAIVGAERHHPVGFLIVLLVLTVVACIVLAKAPTRTRAGKEALQAYQDSHARPARAPLEHELLLAVALSGAVVLSGTAYADVYSASKTMSAGSGGDGSGSGCGGSGCGGGGCGGCS